MARKRWGIIAGGATVAICIPLAMLDGGVSAFASWSVLQTSLAAGTVQGAEVVAALKAGKAVKKLVDGAVQHNEKKRNEGAAKVKERLKEALEEQNEEGNVEKLLMKIVDEHGDVIQETGVAVAEAGAEAAEGMSSVLFDAITSLF